MTSEPWSLIAHSHADLGVGEISRRLYSLLVASGVEAELVRINASRSRQSPKPGLKVNTVRNFSNVISCVNPDQLAYVVSEHKLYKKVIKNHVGYWAWELEDFPKTFHPAFDLVNEVWTFSGFIREALSKSTDMSIKNLPVPVPLPKAKTLYSRADFGLSDNTFLVITTFDYFSDVRRKNPEDSILAFIKAFKGRDKAMLIVKSINSQFFPLEHQRLQKLAQDRDDIRFMDDYLSIDQNMALLEMADVVLSLHRSEGYGINLADAMVRSTPVVCTGYSGNLEFMDEDIAVLVPYSLVPVERYANVTVNSFWAQPDVSFAAQSLRNLYENRSLLQSLGKAAQRYMQSEHSLAASVRKFRRCFDGD